MEVRVVDRHFGKQTVNLSLLQRMALKINGYVYLFHARKEGWKGKLPFYLVRCKKHGIYYLDYPHGYRGYFNCPKCWEEMKG